MAKLNAAGAAVMVVTDDPGTASAIASLAQPPRTLVEIDTGGARAGLSPEDPALLEVAARLRGALAGVMTHGGHSYAGRSVADMVRVAEMERAGVVRAAERLAAAGFSCPVVSVGSTPTALHAAGLEGVTEVRAGVYMFSDLFQTEIGSGSPGDVALTVLASVVGRRGVAPGMPAGGVLLDAGGLALSLDRSTAAAAFDYGYGLMLDVAGQPAFGDVAGDAGVAGARAGGAGPGGEPASAGGGEQGAGGAEPRVHDGGRARPVLRHG